MIAKLMNDTFETGELSKARLLRGVQIDSKLTRSKARSNLK